MSVPITQSSAAQQHHNHAPHASWGPGAGSPLARRRRRKEEEEKEDGEEEEEEEGCAEQGAGSCRVRKERRLLYLAGHVSQKRYREWARSMRVQLRHSQLVLLRGA